MPTDSAFFTIQTGSSYENYPLQGSAWQVQVRSYINYAMLLANVNDFSALSVGPELNGPGLGSITLDADGPFWSGTLPGGAPMTTILDNENLWEAYQDGILRFQWLGTTVEEHYVEDDGTRQITISGPGAAQMLTWACVMPPNFPPASEAPTGFEDPLTLKYVPTYPVNTPAMAIWLDQLTRARSRGTIGWVQPTFTDTHDSAGDPWEQNQLSTATDSSDALDLDAGLITLELGTNLLDLLNAHTGQDRSKQFAERTEWIMRPGFKLDVRKSIGTHREDQVVFFEANLKQRERVRSRDEIGNYIVTKDTNGSTSFASDADSAANFGQRELMQTQNPNITDPTRRASVTQIFLQQHKDEKDQWTIQVPYDYPGRRPFVDYDTGDWIGISRLDPTRAHSILEPFRVMAITIAIDDNSETQVELVLQSRLELRQKTLEAQMTALVNSLSNLGPPDGVSNDLPAGSGVVTWGPDTGYTVVPSDLFGSGTAGGGSGGDGAATCNTCVFIQPTDPASAAKPGDFWYDTSYKII